jgi:hypothetical protein
MDGFLSIEELVQHGLPWHYKGRNNPTQKKTLKIEVFYQDKLILLRIIHFDKFYTLEYPRIACKLADEMSTVSNSRKLWSATSPD